MDEMCGDGFLHKLLGDNPNIEYICIDIYIWFWETIHQRKMIEYVSSMGLYSRIEVN